ncbi:MAG: trehalose-phosphatase [Acidimicrobiales bacterium]
MLDFDGTLAAIVDDPPLARPLDGVVPVLRRLTDAYRLVAVISGRPAAFLAEHLAVDNLVRWGAYGLERVASDGSVIVAPEVRPWQPVVAAAVERARSTVPPGVGVEDKGVALTLHVRNAPEHGAWVRRYAAAEAIATGLVEHDAKMSVELRPPLAVDKGTVVARLLDESNVTAACFAGDDLGDLSAFVGLSAAPVAIRIAVRSAETPAALIDGADLVVDGPEGVLEMLEGLVP